MWTDRPSFSLCAVPLESLGPVFQDGKGERGERVEVQGIPDWSLAERLAMRGGGEQVVLMVSGNYGTGRRRVT